MHLVLFVLQTLTPDLNEDKSRVGHLVRGRLGYEDWIVRYVEEYGETGLSDKRLELYVATAHYRTPLCVGVVVTKPDLANGPRERTTQTSCSSLGSVC